MKKSEEILGLPIISISDGLEAGKVKSMIINAEKGAIDYFVVDNGVQIFGAGLIPAAAVLGIGEYALTIESNDVIADINKMPDAIELLKKDVRVAGTEVMTKKGRLIGKINDIFVEEDNNCIISGLEFVGNITQNAIKLIPRDSIITFGKKLTVVKDDVESTLLDMPGQLDSASSDIKFGSSLKNSDVNESVIEQNSDTGADAGADIQGEGTDGSAAFLYEQKQRQYLTGRKATKTIKDEDGNIIINKDDVIDGSIIDEAKEKGKLVELVMNNRA